MESLPRGSLVCLEAKAKVGEAAFEAAAVAVAAVAADVEAAAAAAVAVAVAATTSALTGRKWVGKVVVGVVVVADAVLVLVQFRLHLHDSDLQRHLSIFGLAELIFEFVHLSFGLHLPR